METCSQYVSKRTAVWEESLHKRIDCRFEYAVYYTAYGL